MQLLAKNLKNLTSFFGADELSKNFWRNLGQIPSTCTRLLRFLFFYAFCIGCKLGKTNMFAGLMQDNKVMREKDICPKFCYGADLKFQAQYRAEL